LLVRCKYDGEPQPLWVLPGGRQEDGETIAQAIVREFREETNLRVEIDALAYVSESIDERRRLHVVNCTFFVRENDPTAAVVPEDPAVTEARFVPVEEAPALLAADVLRIPVTATLSDSRHPRYFAFDAENVAVPFFGRLR